MDEDVEAARRRGLPAVQLQPLVLQENSLQPELAAMGGKFDAVVYHARRSSSSSSSSGGEGEDEQQQPEEQAGLASSWWQLDSLGEVRRVLKPGGRLCVQAAVGDEAAVRQALLAAGFRLQDWDRTLSGACRLVAVVAEA